MTFEYQFLLRKILQGKISCRSKEKPAENKFDIIPVHTTSEEFENKAFLEPRPEEVHDPLIFLDFIPCSLLINALFTSCSLDPQKCLSLFAIFVCLFCLSIYSRKKQLLSRPFFLFEMRSCRTLLASFLSIQLSRLPLRMVKHIKEKDKIIFKL